MTTDQNDGVWLDPASAGKLVPGGLGAAAIRKWCREGKIPGSIQLPSGRWKIPASAIEQMILEGSVSGG